MNVSEIRLLFDLNPRFIVFKSLFSNTLWDFQTAVGVICELIVVYIWNKLYALFFIYFVLDFLAKFMFSKLCSRL